MDELTQAQVDRAYQILGERYIHMKNNEGGKLLIRAIPLLQPSAGLLMSMAIRLDHGLGIPGHYDGEIYKMAGRDLTHARRLEVTITQMRQVYEEVVGTGFYKPEKERHYADLLVASIDGDSDG